MNGTFETQSIVSALIVMDAVAGRFLALAAPIHFEIAPSLEEREAIYRLRYRVVIDKGWAAPEDFPGGLERDAYDDRAILIGGWEDRALVAAARLVFPKPGALLPTEDAFELVIEPRGQVVDMGRQIVAREYGHVQNRIFYGLLARTWIEMRARGFHQVCGVFTPSMVRLYRLLGLQMTVLGPSRRYWNEDRSPVRLDILDSVPALIKRWGDPIEHSG